MKRDGLGVVFDRISAAFGCLVTLKLNVKWVFDLRLK